MASVIGEAVVGKVFEIAVEMAVQKLSDEANLVRNFRQDFRWLNKKLTYVRGFLRDADQQSRHNEGVKEWLESIRGFVLHAEDIFEECAVQSMYGDNAQSCGLSRNQLIFRWSMGRKIRGMKNRMRSIIEDGNELNLLHEVWSANEASPTTTSQSGDRKKSNLLPSDSHPVGIQSKIDDILSLLDNNASPVVGVVGMGGLGKTYLLQQVCNVIRERYEISIWLSVSQSYSISKLQNDLAFQLDENLHKKIKDSGVSEQVAAKLIYETLQGKRCLVVLDDVWRASREDDLLARLGLLSGNNNPCKIVVTTRSREVCSNLNAEIYLMQHLSDEDSWRLFCFYAFGGSESQQHLEDLGRKIVKQCGNLPLATKTVAASLAKTRLPTEWESKLHELEGVVATDVDRIMPILRLSYDSLPARLKACFAYLSFFPEDEEIDCEYLINLWIGEGLIPAGDGQWDAAWDCLYQLDNLCLLQLWEQVGYQQLLDERLTKYCRIHDLLLDLAIQVSRESKCVFSLEEASKDASADCCRIILAEKNINDDDISKSRPVCLRTFSLSQNERIEGIPTNLFTAMRGLRVLDLSGTFISTLPESIGKMKLLKLLNLRDTYIEEVPECVRHLKSLLFLYLPWRCEKLPVWINEVKCLQHLECELVRRMPKGLSMLVYLRTLRSARLDLSVEEDEFMRLQDFANMTQLQELQLIVNDEMEWKGIEEGILVKLVKMRRLVIQNSTSSNAGELPEKMKAMKHLESLGLWNCAVPSWICDLANLRDLELGRCDCIDCLELQKMPNLVRLVLWRTKNNGREELPKVFGKAGGFPCLRFLEIGDFDELEEFPELVEGEMACLEELRLFDYKKVKRVALEPLKRLKLFDCRESGTAELKETLKEGGAYWRTIKAINPHLAIRLD